MAGTQVNVKDMFGLEGGLRQLVIQNNNTVTDLETLRAALAAGGVTAVTELMADHATFKTAVDQTETLIEELHDDHATFKTAVDQTETLIEELHDDHATFKTAVDQTETLIEELHDDHATVKTFIDELKADYELLRAQVLHHCVQAAGLAEGTNANTIKTVNAVSFAVNGALYTKAVTDNIAMTAAAQQAVSTFCLYLVSINASGTVTVTKGTELGTDTATLPALPANEAPLGQFKVATDGSTTFTSGTTDLGAAGLTVTFQDLSVANTGSSASSLIAATAVATITAPKPASGPATLTAAKPASAPATLTAPKPASGPATLSASVPSATAVDTAGDLIAAKIGNEAGTAITV